MVRLHILRLCHYCVEKWIEFWTNTFLLKFLWFLTWSVYKFQINSMDFDGISMTDFTVLFFDTSRGFIVFKKLVNLKKTRFLNVTEFFLIYNGVGWSLPLNSNNAVLYGISKFRNISEFFTKQRCLNLTANTDPTLNLPTLLESQFYEISKLRKNSVFSKTKLKSLPNSCIFVDECSSLVWEALWNLT